MLKQTLVLFCYFVMIFGGLESANILLIPVDAGYNSRVKNVMAIGHILVKRGHNLNMLMSEAFINDPLVKKANQSFEGINMVTYALKTEEQGGITVENQDFIDTQLGMETVDLINTVAFLQVCPMHLEAFLKDKTTWKNIESLKIDLIIADEFPLVARMLAKDLKVPFILYQNWGIHAFDPNFQWPLIPSFMPAVWKPYKSDMKFVERVHNVWTILRQKWYLKEAQKIWYNICMDYKPKAKPESICQFTDMYQHMSLMFHNAIPLIQTAMPTMPNYISIEGFFHKEIKPLTLKYSTFVEGSGSAGVIVASFGSLFRRLPSKYAELFAEAFSRVPQRVIWSYEGNPPKNLGQNVLINDWIPLVDLLAHSKTRLFITQCGGTSMYEAINAKMPVIGIPWNWDQPANCDKLTNQLGMGHYLSINTLTSEQLYQAILEVTADPKHKANAVAVEKIYNDRPMKPNDTIVYWVEYALRHNGAPHLRPHGVYKLNIFQYLLLDVIALAGLSVLFAAVTIAVLLRICIGRIVQKPEKKKLQ